MMANELKKLKKKLPKNGVSLIAHETRYSFEYVRLILAGKRDNNEVINAAINIAANYQKEIEELKSKIKTL